MQTALRSKVLALLALLVLYEYKSTNAGAEKAMQTALRRKAVALKGYASKTLAFLTSKALALLASVVHKFNC